MKGVNPLITFCSRFNALLTLITSSGLLAITALFYAEVIASNFFLKESMSTLQYQTMYSSAVLVLASLMSMTHTVPTSNICAAVLAVMAVNTGLLIKGIIDYEGSLPGDFNNWLIAWLALYFGTFLLLTALTVLATVRHSKTISNARRTKCKSCIYSNTPIEPVRSYELTARTMPRAKTVRGGQSQSGGGTIRSSAPAYNGYNDGYNSDDYTTYM